MNIINRSKQWRIGILTAMFFWVTMSLTAQTTIQISPEVSQVSPGSNVTVSISIKNVTDLHLASIAVFFDKSILQFTGSSAGSFMKSNSAGYSVFYYEKLLPKENPDTVRVDQAILGSLSVNGSGDLFSLTFKAVREGISPITITMVELRNLANYIIQTPTLYNGTIVVGTSNNKSPEITSTPLEKGVLGQKYTYQLIAQDPDGDPLTYQLVESPSFLVIDQAAGKISGTPDKTGKFKVVVRVNDGKGGTASQTFWLSVFKTDHAPSAPEQVSPTNNAQIPSTSVTLQWSASVDPHQGDIIRYAVHLISAQIDTVFKSLTDTKLILDSPVIEKSRMYSWTVEATDGIDTVRSDGAFTFTPVSTTGIGDISQSFTVPLTLETNYPNPITSFTEIRYTSYQRLALRVDIYNINGSLIKTLADGVVDEGTHSITWDATDIYNRRVPSGMYIAVFSTPITRNSIHMLITR